MPPITDHPLRQSLSTELHARPFPVVGVPAQAAYLALTRPDMAAPEALTRERAHLIALLDRHGAPHPAPGATHWQGQLGLMWLKWESHTEFQTFTLFGPIPEGPAFDAHGFDGFPADWLEAAPGQRITSALIRIEPRPNAEQTKRHLATHFVSESLAVASVLEDSALIAGDFYIDPAGHLRFWVAVSKGTGPARVGRIVQRICEIETYKSMAMLALPLARETSAELAAMDNRLSDLVEDMRSARTPTEETLDGLLAISSELETTLAHTSYRFAARKAYAALVDQRIAVLRETHWQGRQTWGEFMMRRFDPAMRTCVAVEARIEAMAERARRAGDLLSTRANVDRGAQNQDILERMDERAALQLRLQKTVEGLSVVAISYYAVSLVGYLLYPIAAPLGVSKGVLLALAVLPVMALVWLVVHRIRETVERA